ncbi:exopolysaccharide biosynthesis polyprenyl glycosylphosphotransferase [Coraliomargarita algicola]|uniref:Exopolysaccharide biosynthesis polyprenyl glycosylphosphotransferase n=1 Tax=Coraliomargarita algicola TaxID=3092156 RepID=A0ABZ0RNJ9_9BACT|nr:exopolysaccharide biosynthesis polyprenyl glycosylphosphotransferase [Coraliomargarita sp. J2-16]WPJ96993.1 exopolysaccharide biosynthesis polyprenyl glycosylphosphotransferase [Coraliomargarita sp. J2-16]
MITNRTQGLRLLSHGFVALFMLLLFSVALMFAVYVLELIDSSEVNLPLYILAVFIAGVFSARFKEDRIEDNDLNSFRWVGAIRKTNYQTMILALMLFAVVFTTRDKAISRTLIASFLMMYWLTAVPLNRYIPDWIASFAFRGNHSVRTVFLGSEKSARHLEAWAKYQPFYGIDIIGLITYEMSTDLKLRMPILGEFMDMSLIIEAYKVNQVVLLETRDSDWWVDSVVEICEQTGCRILIYNPWEEYFDKELIPVSQGGHTFFSLQEEPLENPLNRVIKRVLDICISLPVVVFVIPWLCLMVKLMQLKQSPGALFFKQERSGQGGRRFQILKFRTMHDLGSDRSREGEQAKKGDDRIYAFGEFLRKSSLDEFPQFLNVLMGTMSAIGPRPHLIQHDDEFSQQVNIYRTRHFVKPGITGLAQCKGFRGEVTELSLIEERVRYDLQYIRNWSFWLDLWIVIKTVVHMIKPPKSAY